MLIKANNLTKRYGTKLALDNVNLQIDRGQLIAYLGTNGAGKSTTINLLTGLMTPTSGMIARRQGIKLALSSKIAFSIKSFQLKIILTLDQTYIMKTILNGFTS